MGVSYDEHGLLGVPYLALIRLFKVFIVIGRLQTNIGLAQGTRMTSCLFTYTEKMSKGPEGTSAAIAHPHTHPQRSCDPPSMEIRAYRSTG